jgi:hypothetical protein
MNPVFNYSYYIYYTYLYIIDKIIVDICIYLYNNNLIKSVVNVVTLDNPYALSVVTLLHITTLTTL